MSGEFGQLNGASVQIDSTNPLPVTVTGGAGTGNASVGVDGSAAPASSTLIGRIDANGNLQGVSDTNPLQIKQAKATTGTATQVAILNSSFTVLASNAGRCSAVIVNDGTATLYLLLKTGGTASSTVYTYALPPKGTVGASLTIDNGYSGDVIGFGSAANGNAVVTEFTA